jgi:hypothetical protein
MTDLSAARERHFLGMGRRATAAYVLLVVPFSVALMGLGLGFVLWPRTADPDERTWAALAFFATMIVLLGLSLLIPGTVSWWGRVRACRVFVRDREAGLPAVEEADRLSLRMYGGFPVGLETGPKAPAVAARTNRLLMWMWAVGVGVTVLGLMVFGVV